MVQKATSSKLSKFTLNPTKVKRGIRKCNKKGVSPGSFVLYGALKRLILAFFENEQFRQRYSENKTLILSGMST